MQGFSPAKRLKQCALCANKKNIILNVHDALLHQDPSRLVDDTVQLCSKITGVSKTSIYGLLKERRTNGNLSEPLRTSGRKKI